MKLVTTNVGGNLHQAATFLNDFDLAQFVLVMDCIGGNSTVVVLRVEDDFNLDKWFKQNNARARLRRIEREKA